MEERATGTNPTSSELTAKRNLLVVVPSLRQLIRPAPGFAKKDLATAKLDLMALCGFGCAYCSSNNGRYLRANREQFADLTEAQLGRRLYPATSPELTMVWPEVIETLEAEVRQRSRGRTFGAGETLVFSMLTDAFSGPLLRGGMPRRALELLIEHTAFRIRILTKNSIVGLSSRWLRFLVAHQDRVVVGLSTGSLDNTWARRVEIGCPPPSARIRALRALQDAGVPTFGMLCPVFPDVLADDGVEQLVEAIRPERCEHVWAEPYNDRSNWQAVRAGYAEGSSGWNWLTEAFEGDDRTAWSGYATELFLRLHDLAAAGGWLSKLRYLLYERDVSAADARRFANHEPTRIERTRAKTGAPGAMAGGVAAGGLREGAVVGGLRQGVLLQDKPDKSTGRSRHPVFAHHQCALGQPPVFNGHKEN